MSPTREYRVENVQVSDAARAQFGDSYTINGLIYISPHDREALTSPLNVSSATQGLLLVTTNIIAAIHSCDLPCLQDGCLYSAVDSFRTVLQNVLPTAILVSLSPRRAVLLPATDLVAVISEAVSLFSSVDEWLGRVGRISDLDSAGSEAATVLTQFANRCARWIPKLEEISNVLNRYMTILRCESDEHATRTADMVHTQISQSYSEHQLLPIFTQMAGASTIRMSNRVSRPHRAPDNQVTSQISLDVPESAIPANIETTDPVDQSTKMTTSDSLAYQWPHSEFEKELFRSRVYTRSADRTASLATANTTITAHTCSILKHLTLADVSVVSVLRLPIKVEALTNASLYNPQPSVSIRPVERVKFQERVAQDAIAGRAAAARKAAIAAAIRFYTISPDDKSVLMPRILPLRLGDERKYRTKVLPPVPSSDPKTSVEITHEPKRSPAPIESIERCDGPTCGSGSLPGLTPRDVGSDELTLGSEATPVMLPGPNRTVEIIPRTRPIVAGQSVTWLNV